MLGEYGTSGNFGAVFLHQFGNFKLKCNAQVKMSLYKLCQLSLCVCVCV